MNEEHTHDAPEEEPAVEMAFEPDEELGDPSAAQAKVKKLRAELAQAKKEKAEYLDGWQRCKADIINTKKDAAAASVRAQSRGMETLIEDIIPALDGFDMAAGSEAWAGVDPSWRGGIEQVRNQIFDALQRNGITRFGKVGEMFDPYLHEAVQEVDDVAGESHSIVKILRHGYRSKDRVIRPAQVVIKK